ncbi:hypothetical protein QLL95_gp0495 [Cotonvirus japonicus]|uniref:Uncharacterized protein n=1 Tax=Cotonvirus japonicus TaxID=2811091 RepID=A0ABM7NTX2_9VIRU|nr:hypothetical protein QLL95_gp0495 [Cotonvirus japonicus]BCS83628.1 hypothetical protein [Cotonvirus japonicus]
MEIDKIDGYILDLEAKIQFLKNQKQQLIDHQKMTNSDGNLMALKKLIDKQTSGQNHNYDDKLIMNESIYNLLYTFNERLTKLESISLCPIESFDNTLTGPEKNPPKTIDLPKTIDPLICPDCYFKSKNNYELTNHKHSCQLFLKNATIKSAYQKWAINLSKDRYKIWIINKIKECVFYYNLGSEIKNPTLIDLISLNAELINKKQADLIYEDNEISFYINYVTILTRQDKFNFKQEIINLKDN